MTLSRVAQEETPHPSAEPDLTAFLLLPPGDDRSLGAAEAAEDAR
jgi:hypothetical protein